MLTTLRPRLWRRPRVAHCISCSAQTRGPGIMRSTKLQPEATESGLGGTELARRLRMTELAMELEVAQGEHRLERKALINERCAGKLC